MDFFSLLPFFRIHAWYQEDAFSKSPGVARCGFLPCDNRQLRIKVPLFCGFFEFGVFAFVVMCVLNFFLNFFSFFLPEWSGCCRNSVIAEKKWVYAALWADSGLLTGQKTAGPFFHIVVLLR